MKTIENIVSMADPLTPWSYVRGVGRRHRAVYIFDSPKNRCKMSVYGEICFWHLMLAEGDLEIANYTILPEKDSGQRSSQLIDVHLVDGSNEIWNFSRRYPPSLENKNYKICLKTKEQIISARFLPMNWRLLCAARTRARGKYFGKEILLLTKTLAYQDSIAIGDLMEDKSIDAAIMLAVVGNQLASGALYAELKHSLFTRRTILRRDIS